MSKVESFHGMSSVVTALLLDQSSFSFVSCFSSLGVALITFSINHHCIMRQKEFSRKVEMSKVESFQWNDVSNDSSCFELEQFFTVLLFSYAGGSF